MRVSLTCAVLLALTTCGAAEETCTQQVGELAEARATIAAQQKALAEAQATIAAQYKALEAKHAVATSNSQSLELGESLSKEFPRCHTDQDEKCSEWGPWCDGKRAWGTYSEEQIKSWMHTNCAKTCCTSPDVLSTRLNCCTKVPEFPNITQWGEDAGCVPLEPGGTCCVPLEPGGTCRHSGKLYTHAHRCHENCHTCKEVHGAVVLRRCTKCDQSTALAPQYLQSRAGHCMSYLMEPVVRCAKLDSDELATITDKEVACTLVVQAYQFISPRKLPQELQAPFSSIAKHAGITGIHAFCNVLKQTICVRAPCGSEIYNLEPGGEKGCTACRVKKTVKCAKLCSRTTTVVKRRTFKVEAMRVGAGCAPDTPKEPHGCMKPYGATTLGAIACAPVARMY